MQTNNNDLLYSQSQSKNKTTSDHSDVLNYTQLKKDYETKMWDLTKKTNQLQSELARKNEDITVLKMRLLKYEDSREGIVSHMTHNFIKRQNDNEMAIRKITNNLEGQKKELIEEVEYLLEELEKYKKDKKEGSSHNEELSAMVHDQRLEIENLRIELDELRMIKGEKEFLQSKSTKEIETLKNQSVKEERLHSQSMLSLAHGYEAKFKHEFMSKIKQYQVQFERSKSKYEEKISQLEETIIQLKENEKDLINEKNHLEILCGDLELEVRQKTEKNKKLDTSIKLNQTISESVEELKKDVEYWKNQYQKLEEHYQRGANKLSKLIQEKSKHEIMHKAQQYRDKVEKDSMTFHQLVDQFTEQIDEYKSKLQERNEKVTQLNSLIEDLKDEVSLKAKRIQHLEEQIQSIQGNMLQYKATDEEIIRVKVKLGELEVENNAYRLHVEMLEKQIGHLEKKQNYIVSENAALKVYSPQKRSKNP